MERPTIIITGAAMRLGKAIAQTFFKRGCNLVLHYNQSKQAAKALNHEFNQIRKGSSIFVQADLKQLDECERIIKLCLDNFGHIDHLVNNASIFYPTPMDTADSAHFDEFINTNLIAPVQLIKLAASALQKQRGSVVNLIDIYADTGLTEHCFYVAAKAALQGATIQLASKLAPEVRVNGVSPGAILWPDNSNLTEPETVDKKQLEKQNSIIDNTALKKQGNPNNIAATVCYLALDASYSTGTVIKVDGGRRWYI